MKHNPKIPEDEAAGGFYYEDTYYKVLIRNDDNDEIPHYYLKDVNRPDLYCGFILNENLTDPYHKDHHNFIFEDENLIKIMKEYIMTFSKERKTDPYNVLWLYWRLDYDKKEY